MSVNLNPNNESPKTQEFEQYILNYSFDRVFKLLAVELLGYNASANSMDRVQLDPLSGGLVTSAKAAPQDILIDKTTTANVIYIGFAPIGALLGEAVWRIQKVNKASSPISIKWAAAGASTATWNNRATTETYT